MLPNVCHQFDLLQVILKILRLNGRLEHFDSHRGPIEFTAETKGKLALTKQVILIWFA